MDVGVVSRAFDDLSRVCSYFEAKICANQNSILLFMVGFVFIRGVCCTDYNLRINILLQ